MTQVVASLLGADLLRLGEEIRSVEAGGADGVWVDIMDGRTTPLITFGPMVVEALRRGTRLPLYVHLLLERPDRFVFQFARAGADRILFDVTSENPPATLDGVREAGRLVGLSLRPQTPVDEVLPYLDWVDLVAVLSADPAARGHPFLPGSLEKLQALREAGFTGELAVYGGITPETARRAREAGATILVSASALFRAPDRAEAVQALRGAA